MNKIKVATELIQKMANRKYSDKENSLEEVNQPAVFLYDF